MDHSITTNANNVTDREKNENSNKKSLRQDSLSKGKRVQADSERGQIEVDESQRQSGGSSEGSQAPATTSSRPPKHKKVQKTASFQYGNNQSRDETQGLGIAGNSTLLSAKKGRRESGAGGSGSTVSVTQQNTMLLKQLRQIATEKQDQEKELIQAKVEWATFELECDRLRHELLEYRQRERKLAAEKYEETLKLSILTKQTEIEERIKQKEKDKVPNIKKLRGLFSFANPSKYESKKSKDQGTPAEFEDQML